MSCSRTQHSESRIHDTATPNLNTLPTEPLHFSKKCLVLTSQYKINLNNECSEKNKTIKVEPLQVINEIAGNSYGHVEMVF